MDLPQKKENFFGAIVEAGSYDKQTENIEKISSEKVWKHVKNCLIYYYREDAVHFESEKEFGIKYDASIAKNGAMVYSIVRDKNDGNFIFRKETSSNIKAVRVGCN